ncbi:histone deacetylase family protein [Hymenobacter chitinivorans]|uniref:Acetoin utilization deacetylase AcuC-like enzyme n=1 Tax=Hymenobacter chitinivorans DSM 11115 TaxID=1121954 RepID=A0A2M9B5V1_9BACT|nr:histone deacetylase [Hymenobacter chitinivorans]PJJ53307.1 acetoin utilization deacetylase AcuC-like enzyme [Hymenobacter chitinivorans DSM 11115]
MLSIAWAPLYAHPLPENHRFPMLKYELLPEQLLREGVVTEASFFTPQPPPEVEILRTHDAEYYRRLVAGELTRQEERATGFPWSGQLIEREVTILGGTLECARRALPQGIALNIAGGTHHAFADRGEGFCLLNDQAAAANYLLAHEPGIRKILIVDLDVHQGNGTAAIFQHEPRVFTFSMHGARNYPLRKEQSNLDLPLADGTDDATYLGLLADTLPRLLDEVQPDFVFYLAGVDVLATDKLGHLGLSREGCRRRDELVLRLCQQNQLPVVVCMGGGYSVRIADIVEAHANTFRVAAELYT